MFTRVQVLEVQWEKQEGIELKIKCLNKVGLKISSLIQVQMTVSTVKKPLYICSNMSLIHVSFTGSNKLHKDILYSNSAYHIEKPPFKLSLGQKFSTSDSSSNKTQCGHSKDGHSVSKCVV
jgi:hypothetical protein